MKHSQKNLEAYRGEMFQRAISTKTNRKKAEQWARELIGDEMGDYKFHWCQSPEAVAGLVESLGSPANLRANLWANLWDSLCDSLWDSLWANLRANLRDSLWDSLWANLRANLRDNLWDSGWDSGWDSLWDSGWLAFYSYPEKAGLVKYAKEDSATLKAWRKLMKHCFAIYAFKGHIILIDRPVAVKVNKNGNLIDIKFK